MIGPRRLALPDLGPRKVLLQKVGHYPERAGPTRGLSSDRPLARQHLVPSAKEQLFEILHVVFKRWRLIAVVERNSGVAPVSV